MRLIADTITKTAEGAMSDLIGYVTEEELIAYAGARGVTLTGVPAVLLTKALDYIELMEPQLDGSRVDHEQALSWPRTLTTGVPLAVKQAQMATAMAVDSGVDLFPTATGAQVQEETVGPLTTKYFEGGVVSVSIPQVDGLMAPFMKGSGFFLNLVRV